MRLASALCVIAMVLAGCASANEPSGPEPAPAPPHDDRDVAWRDGDVASLFIQDCREFGATYPAPAAAFAVPAGFAVHETSPGTTFVLEVVYRCVSNNVSIAEQLLMLPVVPPSRLGDPKARFQVLLLAGLSAGADDLYAAWGFRDVVSKGSLDLAPASGATSVTMWGGTTPEWSTQTRARVSGESVAGAAGHARIYHPVEPERMLEVAWTAYEEKVDGGAAVTTFDRVPRVPLRAAEATPFFRAGTEYDWTIRPLHQNDQP